MVLLRLTQRITSTSSTCTRTIPLIYQQIARGFQSLPVIDVSALVHAESTRSQKSQVAAALHRACRDVGFFYVSNHGVPASVTDDVLAQAHTWFALPADQKQRLKLSPSTNYRGYQPLGLNITQHDQGFTPDWHEALDYYKEQDDHHHTLLTPESLQSASKSVIHGRNNWPDQIPAFTESLRTYIHHCQHLGAALLRGIALGLGLQEDYFEGDLAGVDGSYWVLRVIHYPPLPQQSDQQAAAAAGGEVGREVQLSCGEHTDYGLLTLVNQDPGVTALQVKNASGEWVNAPPVPGAFVCNIGDMFMIISNGLYQPTLHRVLNTASSKARVSVPFFYEPCFDALVAPAPELCRDAPARYAAVRYGAHLESKVLSNFQDEVYGSTADDMLAGVT